MPPGTRLGTTARIILGMTHGTGTPGITTTGTMGGMILGTTPPGAMGGMIPGTMAVIGAGVPTITMVGVATTAAGMAAVAMC